MKPYLLSFIFFSSNILFSQNEIHGALANKIDSIVQKGLDSAAYPGAQVLVVHKRENIFHKTYGHHSYEKKQTVRKDDLYDFASITKVSSGLPVLMKLYGEGKFDLDAPLMQYLPTFKNSNKAQLTFREMLAHQAQLKPYIVYWKNTLKKNGKYKGRTFKYKYAEKYPIHITDRLYLHKKYRGKIYRAIKKSALEKKKEYKYSGLLFLLLPEIISRLTGENFEDYLYKNIYQPIGAHSLTYKPLQKFPKEKIIPTENDTFFRRQLIQGTVHDEAAAMLNGVSCNAGLFGTAEDLAKLFQLYLDGGVCGERPIIDEKAIKEFTKCQFCESGNRRGLGFDKPMIEHDGAQSYVAKDASPESFGHSGFTGTFVWADPVHEILLVFMSNRVHPTRENRKLYTLNIRPELHQAIYDVLR